MDIQLNWLIENDSRLRKKGHFTGILAPAIKNVMLSDAT